MRCRKRLPNRSMAFRIRGTSAMSMPVPTIIFYESSTVQRIADFRLPIANLLFRNASDLQIGNGKLKIVSQQPISSINDLPINKPSFGHELVCSGWTCGVDMQDFMSMSNQPIGDQHAVATKIDSFRAHVGGR